MKNVVILLIAVFLISGCKKETENIGNQYIAKIVQFDQNCSTCILTFPVNPLSVKRELGESPNNYYQTINLNKSNFEIGQILKVRVRKAAEKELTDCITLYPSYNYENIYVMDYENCKDLVFDDTTTLSYGDCLYDCNRQTYICFDSVIGDSRCPIGLLCFWAGIANARFNFLNHDNSSVTVDLYERTRDTIVDGYNFSFLQLIPYPVKDHKNDQKDYKTRIIIRNN